MAPLSHAKLSRRYARHDLPLKARGTAPVPGWPVGSKSLI
ncbi:hypothetical protein GGR43_000079 [Sphingobium jiangsuense]|uniref:Uncharacterized protein n=1 Tax=Sphingobium jiangsuense TaxID=870476 RepID=A0A7W6BIL9_9SPHN|nr:hypothetical protein [Sphingobium jiangsuense]